MLVIPTLRRQSRKFMSLRPARDVYRELSKENEGRVQELGEEGRGGRKRQKGKERRQRTTAGGK